ncbi:MAG: hypothetical protein FWD35_00775 [Oscillospiraceae bacterium]|nr:hypothetical protein [Oscillospiraceae bacterium]
MKTKIHILIRIARTTVVILLIILLIIFIIDKVFVIPMFDEPPNEFFVVRWIQMIRGEGGSFDPLP